MSGKQFEECDRIEVVRIDESTWEAWPYLAGKKLTGIRSDFFGVMTHMQSRFFMSGLSSDPPNMETP